MISEDRTIWCYVCGTEITMKPFLHNKHLYCCKDCAQGRSCDCAERMQLGDELRNRKSMSESIVHYPG